MKIKYEFVNETVEVEVDEKWGKVLMELDRIEYNNDKKETRRHLMLNLSKDATAWVIENNDPEEEIIEMMNYVNDFRLILSVLNDSQRKLIGALFVKGLSQEEYAEIAGVERTAVTHQLRRIRKKLKKFF